MFRIPEIEQQALDSFSFLCSQYQFQSPVFDREISEQTSIDYLELDIAIEIQLDWIELYPFVLVVRLENGHLPDGYKVSHGRVCRVHLPLLLRAKGWANAQTLEPFLYNGKKKKKPQPSSPDKMRARLIQFSDLLRGSIDVILSNKGSIF